MQKLIIKTESVEQFLARGGKIEKVSTKGERKTRIRKEMKAAALEEIDMSALPKALKIKYGIKG